jgi:hypothetical protein
MSKYNSLEQRAARILSASPVIKGVIKKIYTRLLYFLYKKDYRSKTDFYFYSYGNECETFFGYYDKCPSNTSGMVLSHIVRGDTHILPNPQREIEVALFDNTTSAPVWTSSTAAYNWQQGARLHWLNDRYFIFNNFNKQKNRYTAIVVDANKREITKQFDYPVQDSFQTSYFLSLNYRRLMSLNPDYGYRNLPPLNQDELDQLTDDGVWRIDYNTSSERLIVSLKDVVALQYHAEFDNALHSVNHVMISPDGTSFIFIHRYYIGKRRYDRLLIADSETGNLDLLSDHGMVSHYFWLDDISVIAYLRGEGNIDSYWLINTKNKKFTRFDALDGYGDGHPHARADYFITDTYPDKSSMQHLFLVNRKTGEKSEIGEFYHGFKYSAETRCDLHPRLSRDCKSVFFDSVFSGIRKLYRLDL